MQIFSQLSMRSRTTCGWRDDLVIERKRRLDESGNSSGCLRMADIRFDGTNGGGNSFGVGMNPGRVQRFKFGRVSNRCSSSVTFEIANLIWAEMPVGAES